MVLLVLYGPVVGMSQGRKHPRDIPLECGAPFLSFHGSLVALFGRKCAIPSPFQDSNECFAS
jgi:hypothetical protein